MGTKCNIKISQNISNCGRQHNISSKCITHFAATTYCKQHNAYSINATSGMENAECNNLFNKCLTKVRSEVLMEEKVRAYCLQQLNKVRAMPLATCAVQWTAVSLSNCIHFLANVLNYIKGLCNVIHKGRI